MGGAAVIYTNFSTKIANLLTCLFVTREEVPPLDSDLVQGAGEEANSPAGGARGVGGVVGGGDRFCQHQDCDQRISSFSGRKGRLARSFGLYGYSWEDLTRISDFDNQF